MTHDHHRYDGLGRGRSHAGHGHGGLAAPDASERRIVAALAITLGFMVVEAAGGWLANSLALIADAGHMLTDSAALALALLAARLARRRSDARRSYGYARVPVLAAFVNGVALLAVVVWIAYEAARRLTDPDPIDAPLMMVVAALGLVANIVSFRILQGGSREDLNLRGAALHVMGDLLGSVGALAAAGVILATGWTPIDPILSVLVSLLVLRSAWSILSEATHVLLEGTPDLLSAAALGDALVGPVAGIEGVHHVHAWMLTPGKPIVTLHARLAAGTDSDRAIRAVEAVLRERFGVTHTTIQVEFGDCAEPPCDDAPAVVRTA
jgi:cobalt-zinc-cadmium efflux system protein